MMRAITICLAGLVIMLVAPTTGAGPTLVNFEGTGLSEGANLTTQIAGLVFLDTIIAKEGSPVVAFSTGDTAVGGAPFGGFFITDAPVGGDYGIPQPIEISFDIPARDVSFSVADLEWVGGYPEVLTAEAFDAANTLLERITIMGGDLGTGDEIATLVELSTANISRLTLAVTNESGRAGWGLDNLSFTTGPAIPAPGAILLATLGTGLVSWLRRRRTL